MSTHTDHIRIGDRIATIGRVTAIEYVGHWALLTTDDDGQYLANGGIVNLNRYSAIHLRTAA